MVESPRAWFDKFSTVICGLGFHSSDHDSALFLRSTSVGRIILLLYVDDMIITGDDTDGITHLKSQLQQQFEMKDLGPLRYFLGIEVASSPKGYLLSQSKYAVHNPFLLFPNLNRSKSSMIRAQGVYSVIQPFYTSI